MNSINNIILEKEQLKTAKNYFISILCKIIIFRKINQGNKLYKYNNILFIYIKIYILIKKKYSKIFFLKIKYLTYYILIIKQKLKVELIIIEKCQTKINLK